MQLIIIHGPPASGKYTLATALGKKLNYSVLHNHLTVDLALQVYPEFGGADFFSFVDGLRGSCLKKACENAIPGLIMTLCYDQYKDKENIRHWVEMVKSYHGFVTPIFLHVALDELKKRVEHTSRVGTQKIQRAEELEAVIEQYDLGPIEEPPAYPVSYTHLTLPTTPYV